MRKRRRWIILIVQLLVGGAVVNVGVAWGFVLWAQPPTAAHRVGYGFRSDPPFQYRRPLHDASHVSVSIVKGLRGSFWVLWDHYGWTQEELNEINAQSQQTKEDSKGLITSDCGIFFDGPPLKMVVIWDAGWPRVSLRALEHDLEVPSRRGMSPLWDWAVPIPGRAPWTADRVPFPIDLESPRTFPLFPLWPGFAINTIFYALILAAPWVGFVQVRRFRRARRGACAQCGYDLSATPADMPCPECGTGHAAPETRVPPAASPRVVRATAE